MADWTKLPEELLTLIVVRLFSVVELLRFRSTCTSWRSSAATTSLPVRPLLHLNPLVVTLSTTNEGKEEILGLDLGAFLSRASFFRVTLSSSSSQGWLIKYDDVTYGTFRLLNPLSRFPLRRYSCKSIDLYEYNVSEIQQAYITQDGLLKKTAPGFKRLVLARNGRVLGVGCDGRIRYWNGEIWTRIKDQTPQFCDIIVHQGLTYALDSNGIVWWISSSLDIYRYGPSLDGNVTSGSCRDLSLVECCGEFYIVHRLLGDNLRKRRNIARNPHWSSIIHDDAGNTIRQVSDRKYHPKTVGFEVYKVDEELGKWVEVKSLGDKAFVMATDACFSISAREFYGCMQNAIYFSNEEEEEIKMFKLDDGSITTMSGFSLSFFQMFVPNFGRIMV